MPELLPALLSALGAGITGYGRQRQENEFLEDRRRREEEDRAERAADRERQQRREALMMSLSGLHDAKVLGDPAQERITRPEDLRQGDAFGAIRGGAIDIAPRMALPGGGFGPEDRAAAERARAETRNYNTTDKYVEVAPGVWRDVTTTPGFRREEQQAAERRGLQFGERERGRVRAETEELQGQDAESLADAAAAAGATPAQVESIRSAGRTAPAIYSSVMSRVEGDRSFSRQQGSRRLDPLMIGGQPFQLRDGKLVQIPAVDESGAPVTLRTGGTARPETINAFLGRYGREMTSYDSLAEAWKNLEVAASQEPNAVNDLAMVIALAKAFDPGSVVREGEVTVVRKTTGLPDWVFSAYNGLAKARGGTTRLLDNATRQRIYQVGRDKAERAAQSVRTRRQMYEEQGRRMGIEDAGSLLYDPFAGTSVEVMEEEAGGDDDLAGYIDSFGSTRPSAVHGGY